MSIPFPFNVSPSTTVVEVNPLQNPYTPVQLNAVVYPGQVVTILDATSSFGAITTPIVISTSATNTFLDGTFSTLINQPQGFVTAQSYSTNKWAFLNSFPFRNQNVSAGLLNLTTSTLYSQVGSTLLEYVSSLVVQNLRVTGNFIQSEGIQLNTNVSSLGTVELLSSLDVWGNTYLSSSLLSGSPLSLYSSLLVEGNFSTVTLATASTMYLSSSLTAIGPLSTSFITVKDELKGTTLEVQQSSLVATFIAGSVSNSQNLQILSSLYTGGSFEAAQVQVQGNANILSSASFFQNASILGILSTQEDISVEGRFGIGGPLSIGNDLDVKGNINVNGLMTIGDSLLIGENLITSTLTVNTLESLGDYQNLSTIAQISRIFAEGDVGAGYVSSSSTFVAGAISTQGDFVIGSNLTLTGNLTVYGGISTFAGVRVSTLSGLGGLSSLSSLNTNYLSTTGTLIVESSTILYNFLCNVFYSTFIGGDLMVLGNLFCGGTLAISSIALPSSLIADTVSTGRLFVGTQAITSNLKISSIVASSVTVGYIPNSKYPFDLSGSIILDVFSLTSSVPVALSLLSTSVYKIVGTAYGDSRSYLYTNGMGVGTQAVSSLEVVPLAYFNYDIVTSKVISSATVNSQIIQGTFIGDGSQISNLSYPAHVSALTLSVRAENTYPYNPDYPINSSFYQQFEPSTIAWLNDGSILINPICNVTPLHASTLRASTLAVVNSDLFIYSTMTVGSLVISGSGNKELNTANNLIQADTEFLYVNDVLFDRKNILNRRVLVNQDVGNIQFSSNANLGVFHSLAVDSIAGSYNFNLDTYRANNILISNVIGNSASETSPSFNPPYLGGIYVSTGILSTITGKFFIGENDEYDKRFNIVQPYRSTLQFNSTLFVNRQFSSVGINTQPNFNLDVKRVYTQYQTIGGPSSVVSNKVFLQPFLSTIFYAFGQSNAINSNTLFSGDVSNWSNFIIPDNNLPYTFTSLFSPGISLNSNETAILLTYTLFEQNLKKFFLGSSLDFFVPNGRVVRIIEYNDSSYFPSFIPFSSNAPNIIYSMATNGSEYFTTGIILPLYQSQRVNTVWRLTSNSSNDLLEFQPFSSNIFPPFTSPTSYTVGGYSILYGGVNAPIWVVVGVGKDGPIYRSVNNGSTWSVVDIGTYELRSIISTPLPENGGIVFLTCGSYLAPSGTTFLPTNGFVFASTDFAENWTLTGSNFTGPVVSLATDGNKVVAAVQPSTTNYTLWYSYLTSSNTYNWQLCSGDLFTTRANSVIYSGSLWVAGGDSGFRQSYDGINWFNPGTYSNEISNVSYMSNAATSINFSLAQSTNLLFQESPQLDCQRLISVPTISYYASSILNLNNACILDEKKNFIVPGAVNTVSPLAGTTFHSTFYTPQAFVSSVVSTNQIQIGAYRPRIQYIV